MPIEIKELIITATVQQETNAQASGGGGVDPAQKKEIVQECVAQVMEILREKEER
jgi:hypothetical protein